jgi:uncharacterized protein YndB with AHSA1/START domain
MTESRTVSISIRRPPAEVYDFLAEPANFPRWSIFITAISRDGDEWLATTPGGTVRISFTPRNDFGIVDHSVTVSPALQIYVPLRVVANGDDGSEVIFTVFRLPGMTAVQFAEDLEMVTTDLAGLKRVLEG